MLIMVMLFVLTVMVAGIYWHMFGENIMNWTTTKMEFIKMKRSMEKLRNSSFYTFDDALRARMDFNKRFWGNDEFKCPRIVKRYIDRYPLDYVIRF